MSHIFPSLYNLAMTHLAVQGTSVASERVFSTAGAVISDRRSRLAPEMVNALIFLNKNWQLIGDRDDIL